MKNKLIFSLGILFSFVFTFFSFPGSVYACMPIYSTPQESFNRVDAVFLGQILSVATSSQGDTRLVTGNVQVNKYWKGNVGRTIKITSSGMYTCATAFGENAKGSSYLIYAYLSSQSPETYTVGTFDIKLATDATAEISALGASRTSMSSMPTSRFERSLMMGSVGPDVVQLQTWLESNGYLVMRQGISKGYFGLLTKNALIKYQVAQGIIPAIGYFGPLTRAKIII